VSDVLVPLGAHLPAIGLALGVLGGLLHTFQASQDNDKNVAATISWLGSIHDWLMLITGRLDSSNGDIIGALMPSHHHTHATSPHH
jgi:hypothetical protein